MPSIEYYTAIKNVIVILYFLKYIYVYVFIIKWEKSGLGTIYRRHHLKPTHDKGDI